MTRTNEERIKFDSGLAIGVHLVLFTYQGAQRKALVKINARGVVTYLTEPRPGDMYTSWSRLKGNKETTTGGVMVWANKQPGIMALFEGTPVATIELTRS